MEKGRKAAGSAAHKESLRVVKRLRELAPKVGPTQAARMVGCSQAYASLVNLNQRGQTLDSVTVNSLELRRSDKLCRKCGEKARLITSSYQCVTCELLELGRQGVIQINDKE